MNHLDASIHVWEPWMRRALQLASLAEGNTSPNPLVGAVVLDAAGDFVGEGFHSKAGMPHAEVLALDQAGKRAKGGTLVVTLEPCSHQGKTPPCSKKVVRSGVSKVVIAMQDPDPRVSGAGIRELKNAGIEVIIGVLEEQAAYQNRTYCFRIKTGRAWGTLKWAMSLDGRTGLPNGSSQWISGQEARQWVYDLRSKCDAVIVGGGTVRLDNPLLTSRGRANPEPLRVVFSRTLDLPLDAQLWDTTKAKTLIVHGNDEEKNRVSKFPNGPEMLCLDSSDPINLLEALAQRNCNRALWECGAELAALAIRQGCVQEIMIVVAPKLLGGLPARTPIADLGFEAMDQVLLLEKCSFEKLGTDWLINVLLPHAQY